MKQGKKLRRALTALLAAAVVCVALENKYNVKVTEYRLAFEKLPAGFDGFRIVQLSDLHGMEFGRDNRRLVELCAGENPDIIVFTGDMAERERDLETLEKLLEGLASVAPVYFVSGNHEYSGKNSREIRALAQSCGAICLDNNWQELYSGGDRIVIAGADDPNGRADMPLPDTLAALLRQEYPEDFVLWLGHRNYWAEKYPELPVDLILSGHAHGGIVRLPFVGGVFSTAHGLGATYEKGLYKGDEFTMLVSRGLGNSTPVPRFLNGAELVSIVLEKK